MDLVRVLNSVGKSTFVKYYYNFRDKSRDECIMLFDEDFTDKAKALALVMLKESFVRISILKH